MPIANILSVMTHGILCHHEAAKLDHHSVALQGVQDIRDNVHIPNGLPLHKYANLYFHSRNPMMYLRKNKAAELCVLLVSEKVLSLAGVIISDQNAASRWAIFCPPEMGLKRLNFDMIYAENWKHPEDQILEWQHKSAKCAEVLVPNVVPLEYIQGAYVVSKTAGAKLKQTGFELDITINPHLFFA